MARLFILIKRKGAKTFKDAIPARKGISKVQLQKKVRKSLKPGLTFRIITETQFKSMLLRQSKSKGGRRPTKVKRRKRVMKRKKRRK